VTPAVLSVEVGVLHHFCWGLDISMACLQIAVFEIIVARARSVSSVASERQF
jgi:hypothetical protein